PSASASARDDSFGSTRAGRKTTRRRRTRRSESLGGAGARGDRAAPRRAVSWGAGVASLPCALVSGVGGRECQEVDTRRRGCEGAHLARGTSAAVGRGSARVGGSGGEAVGAQQRPRCEGW